MSCSSCSRSLAALCSSVHTTSASCAGRRRCRGTGRGGCCASRCRRSGRAEIRPRHAYRRVLRRDGAIDAGDG